MNIPKPKTVISNTLCRSCKEKQLVSNDGLSGCSCAKCDSFECFALRNKRQCSCNPTCRGSPTCMNSDTINNANSGKNLLETAEYKSKNMSDPDTLLNERIKKDVRYECSFIKNPSTVKKHSRYSYSGIDPREKDRTTDNLFSDTVTHAHSATVVYSRKEIDSDAAKLSAQIMNVPYKDFTESISCNKSDLPASRSTKLSKFDIFKRIKEAYKACSCKVCECIIGKSLPARNNYCKCKPCDCKDCASLVKNLGSKRNMKQYFIGCPCIRCDREQCKGIVKKSEKPLDFCDCNPCDCLKCSDSFTKPCNCKPCECVECKSYAVANPRKMSTIVVSTMCEDIPRSYCQCSPCDCAECGQDYPMSSTLRHEMATGISRPPNCSCDNCVSQSCEASDSNSCSCEIQKKIMRKPVEKDTRDYDIHRASVKNISISEKRSKNDTIAMFAAIVNNYPSFQTNHKNCSCVDCECIICSCKENTIASVNKSRCFQPLQELCEETNKGACKCVPCECEVCVNTDNKGNKPGQCQQKHTCKCDVCDCINCIDISKPSTSNAKYFVDTCRLKGVSANNDCKCSPCECTDCQQIMHKCPGDKFINETVYLNKAGYYASPCNFGIKLNNNNTIKTNFEKSPPLTSQFIRHATIRKVLPDFDGLDDNPVKEVKKNSLSKSSQYVDRKEHRSILTCESYVQCKDKNVIQQYFNRQVINDEMSVNLRSESSSFSMAKQIEQSSSMPPASIQKCTSYETPPINSPQNKNTAIFSDISITKCLNSFTKFNFDFENVSSNMVNEKRDELENSPGNNRLQENGKYDVVNLKLQNHSYVPPCNDVCIEGRNLPDNRTEFEDRSELVNNNIETLNKSQIGTLEIKSVRDLSIDLVNSLRSANRRLANLMNGRDSQINSNLGPSKASISLPSQNMKENNSFYDNSTHYNAGDLSNMDIDYDQINNTLRQARAFSEELIKVLDEYKKANERLQNRSQNQIALHRSYDAKYLNMSKPIISNIMCERYVDESKQKALNSNYDFMKKYGSHNLNIENIRKETEGDDQNLLDNLDNAVAYMDANNTNIGQNVESYDCSHHSDDSVTNKITNTTNLLNNNHDTDIRQSTDDIVSPNGKFQSYSYEDRRKSPLDKRSNKGGNRLRAPRSLVLYKRLKLKEALVNLASNTSKTSAATQYLMNKTTPCDKHNVEAKKTLANNSSLKDTCQITTSTSTPAELEKGGRRHELQVVNGENENATWSILRKNCLINSTNTNSRGSSLIPPLQLEIKDTLRAMSRLQRDTGRRESNNESNREGNEAMQKLDFDVKDFSVASSQTRNISMSAEKAVDCMDDTFSVMALKRQIRELLAHNMTAKHPVVKKSLKIIDVADSAGSSIKACTAKASIDPLKVKFASLRRVSDHTVLVKWKVPIDVHSVEGYELLVDGRPVQKIISPSRCMAVVTCLPHVDKVLITIRTLVSSAVQCAYYPSSTIVYRMRPK